MPTSPHVHIRFPWTCKYVISRGKRAFVDVIKNLEVGSLSWVIQWVSRSHKGP